MTEDEYQNLAATYLSMLMRRDAEIWAKRMYFDHADQPGDLAALNGPDRTMRMVRHQRREEEA